MAAPIRNAALLLLGHGSTLNADSSAPTYQHAEAIRRRNIFAEVHVAFWKEEPNFRQALRQTQCREVYVVPNFISSGYFTEQVIPRELGLTGPVTSLGAQDIFYCQPVGLHPFMTEALLRRANEVVASSCDKIAEPEKTACLFICGHGTSLNDNSTKIIHEQVALIRARGLYADCQAALMEQSPFIKDWRTLTDCPDVIVVPFFISDGLHSFEDIPVLLGLTHNIREQSFLNPHQENGRRLWYASAIGTETFIADVVLAQVSEFQAQNPQTTPVKNRPGPEWAVADYLEGFLVRNPSPCKIGEVLIFKDKRPSFDLRHRDDKDLPAEKLDQLKNLEALRELIRLDAEGRFRPLRAAPTLRRGWSYHAPDLASLRLALDYLYPAAVANWALSMEEELPITTWHETAERQTGRFRIVRELETNAVRELVAAHCQSGCLKWRLWSPAEGPLPEIHGLPLICPEACNYLVGKAREQLKGPGDE